MTSSPGIGLALMSSRHLSFCNGSFLNLSCRATHEKLHMTHGIEILSDVGKYKSSFKYITSKNNGRRAHVRQASCLSKAYLWLIHMSLLSMLGSGDTKTGTQLRVRESSRTWKVQPTSNNTTQETAATISGRINTYLYGEKARTGSLLKLQRDGSCLILTCQFCSQRSVSPHDLGFRDTKGSYTALSSRKLTYMKNPTDIQLQNETTR